jgi:hypothetical protein
MKISMAFLDQRRGKINGNTMRVQCCKINKDIRATSPRLRTH